jgi:signal peptidase II
MYSEGALRVKEPPGAEKPTPPAWFWGLVAGGVALDQLTKLFAWLALDEESYVTVVPYVFYLTLRWNPGMAFSLGARLGSAVPFALAILNCVIIGIVIWIRTKAEVPAMRRLFDLAMGLILAGAFGNIIDRVHPPFMVLDFLDFGIGATSDAGRLHWPTFNVADIFIVVGVGVYIFWAWRSDRAAKAEGRKR